MSNVILWTYRELKAATRLSEGTLRKLVKSGHIPAVRVGRVVRFVPDAVLGAFNRWGESGTRLQTVPVKG